MTPEQERLLASLENVRASWPKLTASATFEPYGYSGRLDGWVEFLIHRVEQHRISLVDFEDIRNAFGGYGVWSWVNGDASLGKEIAQSSRAVFTAVVDERGRALLFAARDLFAAGGIVDAKALVARGDSLGFDRRETNQILGALSRHPQFWVRPFYRVQHPSTDPRDVDVDGYELTDKGRAAVFAAGAP